MVRQEELLTHNVSVELFIDSLNAEVDVRDKICLFTVDDVLSLVPLQSWLIYESVLDQVVFVF